jgi:hypothetical protein
MNTPQFEHETPSRQKDFREIAPWLLRHAVIHFAITVYGRICFNLSVGSCLSCHGLDRRAHLPFLFFHGRRILLHVSRTDEEFESLTLCNQSIH